MSAVAKKPPPATASSGRRASTDPNLSNSPTRGSPRSPTPSSTTPNGAVARTRSIRGGTPVSARAAALQRTSTALSTTSSASDQDDARAENVALLDDLKDQLRKAETLSDQFQKQAQVLQSRLDDAIEEQAKLEEKVHENEERNESLENEKRDALRQKREMESIYEAERSSMTKERDEMANREEEMQTIIQRLKDSLNQRTNVDEEHRMSRHSNNASPNLENQFAPPSALVRSDSRNNSKLLLQKDKLIESLRLELAEAQIKLVESENQGGGKLHEVERLLLESRMANARLMEDNESFQLLLSEKTLNLEDFAKDHFGFHSRASNEDALSALEGRSGAPAMTSLADELSEAAEGEEVDNTRRLEAELKAAKDSNKALTLYINKIIERLLEHQDLSEAILDQSSDFKPKPRPMSGQIDKELPPPPPKEQASGASVLQRAKSVAMGGRKPRPQSVMHTRSSNLSDPDTAPSIPFGLGRSSSFRHGRPMSEQYTSAASVVNQMYRGQPPQNSPPLQGPQTPRHSQSFFAPAAVGGNPNAAARAPSGPQVGSAGNFPGMKSETSSTSGDSGVTTPPSNSPPRAEKTTTFAGNKPRPLRLVQDHPDARKVSDDGNKRASWMGWASAAFGKKEETTPNDVIQE